MEGKEKVQIFHYPILVYDCRCQSKTESLTFVSNFNGIKKKWPSQIL